jgi:hypothetical protein
MHQTSSRSKPRPRPKIRPRVKRGPMPAFFRLALHWAAAWGAIGLVLGTLLMVGKAPPFAESGPRSDSILAYAFWIPMLGGGAAGAGLGIGLVYAGLMLLTTDLRDSLEGEGTMVWLGPELLCGALAGLIPGFLVGGLMGALFFATLGASFAGLMKWRSVGNQQRI